MILYYPQPTLHLGPFEIHAYGIMAAIAVLSAAGSSFGAV